MADRTQETSLQVCYVVTTNGDDVYPWLTYISASLVRRLYPSAKVVVLCDEASEGALAGKHRRLLDLADRVTAVTTGQATPLMRNRSVKTQVRQNVEGDFIFLDGDTLPIRPFAELCRGDFAAALDRCVGSRLARFPAFAVPHYEALGWPHPTKRYYNAGVMFMRENAVMRRVGVEWHERWKAFSARGAHQDQPSLNSAIDAIGPDARVLPMRYNSMVLVELLFAWRARIFHYHIATSGGRPETTTVLGKLLEHLQATGEIDWELVDRTARTGDPFVAPRGSVLGQIMLGKYKTAWGMMRK